MSKKVELSAEERAQLVLRFLSREDTAGNLARRAGIAEQTSSLVILDHISFSCGPNRSNFNTKARLSWSTGRRSPMRSRSPLLCPILTA